MQNGLIDMHVHHNLSNVQHLLHIINGITTVREMCGFPWVLDLRADIKSNLVFAPSLYVASNMLNTTQFFLKYAIYYYGEIYPSLG